jgi:hypothetical protein
VKHIALLAIMSVLLSVTSSGAQSDASVQEGRHSGRVLSIGLDLTTIVVEETVAWNSVGPPVVRRSIRLTPRTSIALLERAGGDRRGHADEPGWLATSLKVTELREGDYVTVVTDGHRPNVATTVQVVRSDTD